MPKTVGVAVSNATFHFDKLYTYAVMPDQQNAVKLGSMVLVPFGRGSRARMGVVLACDAEPESAKLKYLFDVAPASACLTPELLRLVHFLKERTFCTYYEAVKAVIPYGAQYKPAVAADGVTPVLQKQLTRHTENSYRLVGGLPQKPKPTAKQLAAVALLGGGPRTLNELEDKGISRAVLDNLCTKGVLECSKVNKSIDLYSSIPLKNEPICLTAEQQAAYDALGSNKGAAIVMEASTGKILAMVSKPAYDPNNILSDWSELNSDEENSPLLNRVTQGSYAPGSTFKVVTTLAFMRQNSDYPNYTYDCNGEISQGDITIHCFNGNAHGSEDLRSSFANSCNSSFANIGLGLDLTQYRQTAEDLLFNKSLPGVLNAAKSSFALDQNSSEGEVMMTAMGQGKTTVSPYHMALIAEAVANGGTMMQPYLVESVTNYTGSQIRKNVPKSYKKVMTSDEAAQLKEYMTAVVEEGTGSVLKGRSYTAAGKTGTAEYSMSDGEKTHSWFMGFTNVDNPDLVISVITEGSDGSSSGKAVAIAGDILDAYYN